MKEKLTDKILELIEDSFSQTQDGKCTEAGKGMVSTAFPEATYAGLEMLNLGGNSVDAACAAALAIGVCEPQGSGIGGQSLAIIHTDGTTVAIDGSSKVPALAHSSGFLNEMDRKVGYRAATIPTTLAVLAYMNEQYGRLGWSTIVQPAIQIASNGYRITGLQSILLKRELKKFLNVPSRTGAELFLKNGRAPYESGDNFIQPALADTLTTIAQNGIQAFYTGTIAESIDQDMRNNGGYLRQEDLALIPEVIEREPVEGTYRGYRIKSLPPPGSGEILQLILEMMERLPSDFLQKDSKEKYHMIAGILHHAFLEYRRNPRNPNTFNQIRDRDKIRRQRADTLMSQINTEEMYPGASENAMQGMGETTHISVMDDEGNAVGITQSLNLVYGAKVATKGLGFLYNNYIEAFQHGVPGHYYNLRPNAIPWPCATPTIVFHNQIPWMVFGSPGSQRIFSSMAQFLSGLLDEQLSMDKAIVKPRIHSEQNGEISLETDRFDPAIPAYLESKGYRLNKREPYSFYMGAIHAALRRHNGKGFQGVADIRRDGIALGI